MSVPRLTFLYPHLFRSIRLLDSVVSHAPVKSISRSSTRKAGLHATARRGQQHLTQRYGSAAEPHPLPAHMGGGKALPPNDGKKAEVKKEAKEEEKKEPPKKDATKKAKHAETKDSSNESKAIEKKPEQEARAEDNKDGSATAELATSPLDTRYRTIDLNQGDPQPPQPSQPPQPTEPTPDGPPQKGSERPMETVLRMDPPSSSNSIEQKPPHLQAPPYVHHFDTFTLVRDLEKGGFTEDQSVTAMKVVRGQLAVNLDMAKDGLVSKSDVENETYLFRAACSELRTEIQNNRKGDIDKMRTERAQLQHEVDILNQKLTAELLTLKDDLKGMFDDRKMAVRMEQRGTDSSIQSLNYKITVALTSDSKSEVEGLRWVLTRRAAMAIITMAFLILGSLRYSSYKIHVQDQQRKIASSSSSSSSSSGTGSDHGGASGGKRADNNNNNSMMTDEGTQTSGIGGDGGGPDTLANLGRGRDPSYVSLG
ncbi:MAG: hypothetical protein M1827_003568 [Pycnora praestabilis]|nr:MAG: hypothetical protein M1827_003568 [Pycnora praestabilis]